MEPAFLAAEPAVSQAVVLVEQKDFQVASVAVKAAAKKICSQKMAAN